MEKVPIFNPQLKTKKKKKKKSTSFQDQNDALWVAQATAILFILENMAPLQETAQTLKRQLDQISGRPEGASRSTFSGRWTWQADQESSDQSGNMGNTNPLETQKVKSPGNDTKKKEKATPKVDAKEEPGALQESKTSSSKKKKATSSDKELKKDAISKKKDAAPSVAETSTRKKKKATESNDTVVGAAKSPIKRKRDSDNKASEPSNKRKKAEEITRPSKDVDQSTKVTNGKRPTAAALTKEKHVKSKAQHMPIKDKSIKSLAGVVTPDDDSSEENDDTSVSDVDVSDVSSVEVSSSEDDDIDPPEDDDESGDESEEDDEEDEGVIEQKLLQKKLEAARKAKEAAEAAKAWKPATVQSPPAAVVTTPGSDGAQALTKGKPFQRVDSNYWGSVAAREGGAMADNSYEKTFGAAGFGARSSEKLVQVRGKDFRHEKNKRKRSFNGFARTGGQIDTNQTFSTKFQYQDDDT